MASLRSQARRCSRTAASTMLLAGLCAALGSCSPAVTAGHATAAARPRAMQTARPGTPGAARAARAADRLPRPAGASGGVTGDTALPPPAPLAISGGPAFPGEGQWHPAGRSVDGMPAVYETTVIAPGSSQRAGIAWMDTRLLSARLYSGSVSPGGGPYRYTAPVKHAEAASLVAAFNGGFKMADAHGGYYTEGRVVVPLVPGAASLVIYADGSVTVGAWGSDVVMTPKVVAVRQNLVPLVAAGLPTALAGTHDWKAWGNTCGAHSCAASVPGIEHQWRSGVGVTADGALVYAAGPALDPLQLAMLLVHAGVVRGMQLDINPSWPVFASFDPAAGGAAAPSNGSKLLATTRQGPWTFFEPSWARDFITMSARRVLQAAAG